MLAKALTHLMCITFFWMVSWHSDTRLKNISCNSLVLVTYITEGDCFKTGRFQGGKIACDGSTWGEQISIVKFLSTFVLYHSKLPPEFILLLLKYLVNERFKCLTTNLPQFYETVVVTVAPVKRKVVSYQ